MFKIKTVKEELYNLKILMLADTPSCRTFVASKESVGLFLTAPRVLANLFITIC